jgi:hypothetical protein
MGGKANKERREGKRGGKYIPMSDEEKLAIPLPKGIAPDPGPAIGPTNFVPDLSKVVIDGNRPQILQGTAKLYD